jgi:3-mercaptopyruvate sulfurtransferase SseA
MMVNATKGIGWLMKTNSDWQAQAKGIIRGELKRRGLGYRDLAERLQAIGVKENEPNVVNKIARGTFTAIFFLQCMEAIGVQNIHLNGD